MLKVIIQQHQVMALMQRVMIPLLTEQGLMLRARKQKLVVRLLMLKVIIQQPMV